MSFMEERLKRFFGEVGHVHAGRLEIEVDGDVKAKFFKAGRLFDVELTCIQPRFGKPTPPIKQRTM